jgi:hypothetical protein
MILPCFPRTNLCNLLISSTRPTLHCPVLNVLRVCVPTVRLSRLSWLSKLYCPEDSHASGGAALCLHCLCRVCFWGQCLFSLPWLLPLCEWHLMYLCEIRHWLLLVSAEGFCEMLRKLANECDVRRTSVTYSQYRISYPLRTKFKGSFLVKFQVKKHFKNITRNIFHFIRIYNVWDWVILPCYRVCFKNR